MKLNTPINELLANFSGSDQITRDYTGEFKPQVTTIYALFGAWAILISLIGAVGGYFFAETFTDSQIVQYFVAVVWGSMILIIERLMIAIPMNHEDYWKYIVLVIFRLLLTFFASVTITDSVITNYFFNDSIKEILIYNSNKQRLQQIDTLQNKVNDTSNLFASRLRTLEEESICLTTLLREEKGKDNSRIKTIRTDSGVVCGSTSGEGASCGDDCRQIQDKIAEKEQQIEQTQTELANMLSPIEIELARTTQDTHYANDMIARTEALAQLKEKHPSVDRTTFFFTGLLILAEMLIVIMKTLMPKLASDYVYESNLKYFNKIKLLEAELSYNFDKNIQKAKYNYQTEHNEGAIAMLTMTSSMQSLLEATNEMDSYVSEYRRNQLNQSSILNLKARRKVHAEIQKVEEMADLAKQTAHNKYISKLDANTERSTDTDGTTS